MTESKLDYEDISALCLRSSDSTFLWDVPGGNRVVKIPSSNVVVKLGHGVTQAEAETQREVSRIIDPKILHVPQVHCFYHDDSQNIGYIVMEFVEGKPIDLHQTEQFEALQNALDHLATLKREFPGPLHSSKPQGILWEDDAPSNHDTAEGLEDWINKWQDDRVILDGVEFVLCHLDTALENILWLPSNKICLLDWASAGYYPRHFELTAHQKKGRPDEIVERLLASPREPFSDEESRQAKALIQACGNAMMYTKPRRRQTFELAPPKRYLAKQPSIPKDLSIESSVKV